MVRCKTAADAPHIVEAVYSLSLFFALSRGFAVAPPIRRTTERLWAHSLEPKILPRGHMCRRRKQEVQLLYLPTGHAHDLHVIHVRVLVPVEHPPCADERLIGGARRAGVFGVGVLVLLPKLLRMIFHSAVVFWRHAAFIR